jgi:exonuclease SbcC
LEFTHNGENYTVFWKFSHKTEECRLYEGETLIAESTGEVGDAIRELINMDSEAFVNSTYVQQTELMRMITSKKDERKKVFDSLLGIDTIEEYIERAHNSEMGVKDAVKQIRTQLKSLENQISDLPSQDKLETQLSQTESQISKKQTQVEKVTDQISDMEDKLEEYQDSIEEKQQLSEQKDSLESDLTEQQQLVDGLQDDCDSLRETVQEKKAALATFLEGTEQVTVTYNDNEEISSLENTIEEARSEQITDTERSVYQKCTEYVSNSISGDPADDPEEVLQTIQQVERADELVLPSDMDELLVDPARIIDAFSDSKSSLQTEIERKQSQLEQQEDLLEEKQEYVEYLEEMHSGSDSKIALQASFWNPLIDRTDLEYQTDVTQEPDEVYEQIEEYLQEDTIDYTNLTEEAQLLYSALVNENSDTQEEITTAREKISDLESTIADLESEKEDIQTQLQEFEEIESEITTLAKHQQWKLEQKRQTLERKQEISRLCELYDEAVDILGQFEDKTDQLEREKDRIESLENEITEVEERLDEVERSLQIDPEKIQTKIDQLNTKKESLQDELPDLQARKSQLQTKIERRGELEQEITTYEERLSEIETTKQELSEVQSVYEQVRQTFREQFVEGINEYANDIFLDKEYGITIYTQNGTTIEPDLSSGGEAALINMTIRAAIYRVVSDMNLESEDPLPPIILDEPTTYLDEGHIEQLSSFIDTLESWNIEQIFIVSHNESLKQRCDKTYNVQINPQTGYSMVN